MESIIVPVKQLKAAKSRLAPMLDGRTRRELGLTMLADVLAATDGRLRIVVTSDPSVRDLALASSCRVVEDENAGLNGAISKALSAAEALGASSALVVPADVPLIDAADVDSIFAVPARVAVAASADGGTGALLLRPPNRLAPAFGPKSASRHMNLEGAVRIDASSVTLDVDEWKDVVDLSLTKSDRASAELARRLVHAWGPGTAHRSDPHPERQASEKARE